MMMMYPICVYILTLYYFSFFLRVVLSRRRRLDFRAEAASKVDSYTPARVV